MAQFCAEGAKIVKNHVAQILIFRFFGIFFEIMRVFARFVEFSKSEVRIFRIVAQFSEKYEKF